MTTPVAAPVLLGPGDAREGVTAELIAHLAEGEKP
jgi:hypothetical protein